MSRIVAIEDKGYLALVSLKEIYNCLRNIIKIYQNQNRNVRSMSETIGNNLANGSKFDHFLAIDQNFGNPLVSAIKQTRSRQFSKPGSLVVSDSQLTLQKFHSKIMKNREIQYVEKS